MAKSPKPSDFEIADGTVLSLRGTKIVFAAIMAILMVFGGFIALFGAGSSCLAGMGIGKNPRNTDPAMLFVMAGVILLFALFFFALAGLMGYWVSGYFRKERFILAADALQFVVGDEVRLHLPYDNISKLNMVAVEVEGSPGMRSSMVYHIAIEIIDPFRQDTLIDRAAIKALRKEQNCDVRIGDHYNMPLKSIYKKLTKKLATQ